jgi:hypothetical protein
MNPVNISKSVVEKIAAPDHGSITASEVMECFRNYNGAFAFDRRPKHLNPDGDTRWFVGHTNDGRRIKIVFIQRFGQNILKTAYIATPKVQEVFLRVMPLSGESND